MRVILARVTTLVAFSALLAACASGGASGPSASATTAATPSSSAAAPASASASASGTTAASSPAASSASAAGAAAPAAGTPLPHIGGTVSVIGSWGGVEQDNFLAMVKPFEDQTGVQVQYTGTRDLNAILTTRTQAGNPPDLAGLPNPGAMMQFAREGKLRDLSTILDESRLKSQYAPNWIQLGTVDGKFVGIFVKTNLKSAIWYDPKAFDQVGGSTPPKTWSELTSLDDKIAGTGKAPWCIGLESGATSGWPGTDWISDIMMRSAGPAAYQQWYEGKLSWTSSQVKDAWQMWGQIVANPKMIYGGSQYVLSTNFNVAGNPLFTNPPGCYMEHQGDFVTGFYTANHPNLKGGTDFNFFPFPSIGSQDNGAVQVSGDLFGMFKDTPQSRALLSYLTTPQAQDIWVKKGGAISPNKLVPTSDYPDAVSQHVAQVVVGANTPLLSAADMMPNAMQTAFYKAVLSYVQNPGQLDSLLAGLDQTRAAAYK